VMATFSHATIICSIARQNVLRNEFGTCIPHARGGGPPQEVGEATAVMYSPRTWGWTGLRGGATVSLFPPTEIGYLDEPSAAFQQNVGRFDIAMHEALSMCGRQPLRRLDADAKDFLQRQRAASLQVFL